MDRLGKNNMFPLYKYNLYTKLRKLLGICKSKQTTISLPVLIFFVAEISASSRGRLNPGGGADFSSFIPCGGTVFSSLNPGGGADFPLNPGGGADFSSLDIRVGEVDSSLNPGGGEDLAVFVGNEAGILKPSFDVSLDPCLSS